MKKIGRKSRRIAALLLAVVCIFTMAGFTNSSAQSEPSGLSFIAGKYTGTGSGKTGIYCGEQSKYLQIKISYVKLRIC